MPDHTETVTILVRRDRMTVFSSFHLSQSSGTFHSAHTGKTQLYGWLATLPPAVLPAEGNIGLPMLVLTESRNNMRRLLLWASWQSRHNFFLASGCCRNIIVSSCQEKQIASFDSSNRNNIMSPSVCA